MKTIHIILFFCLILLIFCSNYISEQFSSNNKIIFLKGNELFDILENNMEYYNTFYDNDLKVRNINSIDEYFDIIRKSTVNFTTMDKDILISCIDMADKILQEKNYNWFDGIKASKIVWKIGLIDGDKYEGGFPHTVKDTIILNKGDINRNTEQLVKLLIHEKVHIYQKKYPDDVNEFLNDNNFIIVKNREEKDNIRANPDIDTNVYMKDNMIYSMVYNNNPMSIMDVNHNNQYYEHPFETMAIMLSK